MKRFCLTLILITCGISYASEVLLVHAEKPYVVVSQVTENPFEIMDRLCIERNKIDIACGDVTYVQPKYAVLKIDYKKITIKKHSERNDIERWVELDIQRPSPVKGDKVRLENREPKKLIRSLTSELISNNTFGGDTINKERQTEIELALQKIENSKPFKPVSVLGIGMSYFFPHLHYQQALSPGWGVGLMAIYMNYPLNDGQSNLSGPGFFFSYNSYFDGPLNGLWWQLSPGVFRVNVKNGAESAIGVYEPAVLTTIGYRMFWENKMNFGIGAGVIYLPMANDAGNTGLAFNGIIPSFTFDAGIAF